MHELNDAVQQDDLFFQSMVNTYTTNPRFMGHNWLANEVEARLADSGCRFVLRTAQPGAGKSAFMAQLASDHNPRGAR